MPRRVILAGLVVLAGCVGSPGGEAPSPSPAESAASAGGEPQYELSCGPVAVAACERLAATIAAAAEEQHPGRTVVSVSITGPDGDYDVVFDDGTEVGADID